MAFQKKNKRSEYNIEFVACDLLASDKNKLDAWVASFEEELDAILDTLGREGYRMTVKYSPDNECFMASLTQQDEEHPNHNKLLSGRAGTPMDAIWIVLYKHVAILNSGSWEVNRYNVNWG